MECINCGRAIPEGPYNDSVQQPFRFTSDGTRYCLRGGCVLEYMIREARAAADVPAIPRDPTAPRPTDPPSEAAEA